MSPGGATRKRSIIMSNRSMMPDFLQTENLYIGCGDGWVYQYGVVGMVLRGKGKVMENEIKSMVVSSDKKTVWVGDRYGHLKRVGVDGGGGRGLEVEKEYDGVHMNCVSGLAISKNNGYLYTASWDASVKKINLITQEVEDQWENSSR